MNDFIYVVCLCSRRFWCQYRFVDKLCSKDYGLFGHTLHYCSTASNSQLDFGETLGRLNFTVRLSGTIDCILYLSGSHQLLLNYARKYAGKC